MQFGEQYFVVNEVEGLGEVEEDGICVLICVFCMTTVFDDLDDGVHRAATWEKPVLFVGAPYTGLSCC